MSRSARRSPSGRPRTKPSVAPFRLRSGSILLARDVYGLARELPDDRSGTLWRLLQLADGRRTPDSIAAALGRSHPGKDARAVRTALAKLAQLGIVEETEPPEAHGFTTAQADRYSRNRDFLSLAALGTPHSAWALQDRLRRAHVTVLGVGAIGGATALSLVAMGVGHVRLVDPDRVERSNLNRQTLFTSADIGRPKVQAAVRRLRALNPDCRLVGLRRLVRSPRDLPPLLRGTDLLVLGADRPHEIMAWTNRAAYRAGTPWLDNGYAGARCAVALFVPGRTPCLACLEAHLERKMRRARVAAGTEMFARDASNPVIAPTAGIAGHLGALQAIYFLIGRRAPAEGRLLQWNLWHPSDVRVERPRSRPGCPICGRPRRRARRATPTRRRSEKRP